jgi:prepilin-type N-terminal cleavage/methylation domain-containing protein
MRPSLELQSGNAGFSLIEVVCAVLILGIALVGLTQGITTALQSSKDSEVQTRAVLMASGLIESLRAEGDLEDGETDGEGDGGLARFTWKESIEPTRIDGLHRVVVTVMDHRSGKSLYELQTLLFETPLDTTLTGAGGQSSAGARRQGGSGNRRGRGFQ